MSDKKPLIVITGPTAVGKSKLAIELAKEMNGEIISADSMQVYRYMNVGTAKITQEEMSGIKHYLIDELYPWEDFNVVEFKRRAQLAMHEIYQKGKIPIIAGGTGFYIQAILRDIDFTETEGNDHYRDILEQISEGDTGHDVLHRMLLDIDPESAQLIHPNNTKRIIRALEFYHMTGTKISDHNEEEKQKSSPYQFCYFVLTDDREKLYQRIEDRVDKMIHDGLVEEVESLLHMGCKREMVSMQGIGYKEIIDYLNNDITLEEAIYRMKRDTRHFAKRQLTWFKREKEVIWIKRQERTEAQLLMEVMTKCKAILTV